MKTIHGNLIKLAIAGEFSVIVHGCNCQNNMGAGIAKQIAKIYPGAVHADDAAYRDKSFRMLGDISVGFETNVNGALFVVNAYTQDRYGRGKRHADYDAIRSCFKEINKRFGMTMHHKIGYPMIGAGLAGGDWNIIKQIIDEELEGSDHTLVVYDNKRA